MPCRACKSAGFGFHAAWRGLGPLLLLALLGAGPPAHPENARPNVVLLLWPEGAFDGANLAGQPNLKSLADRAQSNFQVLAAASEGRPAHAVLLTGLRPQESGVTSQMKRPPIDEQATLAARLRDAGYATFACGALPGPRPAALGFDESVELETPEGRAAFLSTLEARGGTDAPFFLWWAADGEGAGSDAALGELLATLERTGQRARTLFVAITDSAPRGRFERVRVHGSQLRLPVLWLGPDSLRAPEPGLASTLDIVPTLLDAAEVEPAAPLSGRSLLSGASADAQRTVHGALFHTNQDADRDARIPALQQDLIAIYARTARWKYVLFLRDVVDEGEDYTFAYPASAGEQLLFDLESDPGETLDVSGHETNRARLDALRSSALAWWQAGTGVELYMPSLFTGMGAAPLEDLPNVVLIVSDDHDYEHFGFMGHPSGSTPTIDSLAQAGVVFEVAYVPVSRCRPSLAALLSGRWPHQTGIIDNDVDRTLSTNHALPALFKEAGYATFVGGKFWEGSHHAMGFVAPEYQQRNQFVRENQTDCFEFIEQHAGKRPFFLWWAPMLPHGPREPSEEQLARFAEVDVTVPAGFSGNAEAYQKAERTSFAMEGWLDDGVAALTARLRELREYDNTIFVFLIDNGWANGAPSKGSVFEKGLRTPVFFTWPAGLKGERRRQELVSTLDIYPTLLELAGIEVPSTASGISLLPMLDGSPTGGREALFGAAYFLPKPGPPRAAKQAYALYARTSEWKYVLYLQNVTQSKTHLYTRMVDFPRRRRGEENLYRLGDDPYEARDLAALPEHAELIQRLREGALQWWEESGGRELELP